MYEFLWDIVVGKFFIDFFFIVFGVKEGEVVYFFDFSNFIFYYIDDEGDFVIMIVDSDVVDVVCIVCG